MALSDLRTLIRSSGYEPPEAVIGRWTDTDPEVDWEPAPVYGAFVDETARVISGTREPLVSLLSDDPRHLAVSPELERELEGASLVFVDWGRQSVSWEEIFALWEAWDAQGMIAGCGSVGVPWTLASRWSVPGWVAFRDGSDGSPLTTVLREIPAEPVAPPPPPRPTSFLAMARKLRGESDLTEVIQPGGDLPVLPFTLSDLRDPTFVWPRGAA